MIREGKWTPQEARIHPQRGVIIRSLGAFEDIDIDTHTEPVQDGDILVLCTRGLTNNIEDDELGRTIIPDKLRESTERLIQLARERRVNQYLDSDDLKKYPHATERMKERDNTDITLVAVKISL
jgi:serine/threonine protein phosphatase PrpC